MTTRRITAVSIVLSIASALLGGAGPTQPSAKGQTLSGTVASSKRMADGKEWTTANLNVSMAACVRGSRRSEYVSLWALSA